MLPDSKASLAYPASAVDRGLTVSRARRASMGDAALMVNPADPVSPAKRAKRASHRPLS